MLRLINYLFLFLTTMIYGQQFTKVDFTTVSGKILIEPFSKTISGAVVFEFEVLQMTDTIYIDAQKMNIKNVLINNQSSSFKNIDKKLAIFSHFKLGHNQLSFDYSCQPKQAIYFNNYNNNWQIWTQGQGKYTSNWFPSFDDVNEKVIFGLDISFDKNYQVISNGLLQSSSIIDDQKTWNYQMKQPMSSYLLMLAIGKFEKKTIKSKSNVPIELYFELEDAQKFEPTYRYSKEIFDFFEKKIGISYPWQIYKQIPVRDFLYAGMENTSATIFSRDFVIDTVAFNDKNYIDVNAHELAHQWFGNLVTAKSGQDHWLQEGFATYYALLAEKEILGQDYFYNILNEFLKEFKYFEKTDATPVLNEKASSMTFYKKGAWALFVLENEIGEKSFKKSVKNYLEKYSFQNVETKNFLDEVKKVCNYNTQKFSQEWLETSKFNFEKANQLLLKNKSIVQLFKVIKLREVPFENKRVQFETLLKSNCYYTLKEEVLFQLTDIPFALKQNLLLLALNTKDLKVRQAVASTLTEIPESFRLNYESLINDKSYETIEIAFKNLINNFPMETKNYLNRTKNICGFNDKSFEMLWITTSISAHNYDENSNELLAKLSVYSSNKFEFAVRQNAFLSLQTLQKLSDENLVDLLECCQLTNWRSAKWSKEFLKSILKNEKIKSDYTRIQPTINENNLAILKKFL